MTSWCRIGYKNSMVLGLVGMAASALVFLPAAGYIYVLGYALWGSGATRGLERV
jgi:fucose permease